MVRLLKLGIYDPAYLDAFYEAGPCLAEQSYEEQHRALIEDRAASSDFWTAALARIGYETADLIANAEPLQRRWAVENGRAGAPAGIAAAQIEAFAPDILLVADVATFGAPVLRDIRARCPSIRRIIGWCGAPYRDLEAIGAWDVALSCIPEMVADFRARGIDAHHVDHGFDPRLLDQLGPPAADAPTPFSFLGSVIKGAGYHQGREALLVRLIEETPLEIWSNAGAPRPGGWRNLARRALGRAVSVHARIAARAKPPLHGLAMFRKLRDSAVTLNTHIDVSPRSASNMRLFEACGTGACQLTDWKENIARLFEPDSEVVTYRSADEAIEKYLYLADHPGERAAIAAAGQLRALRDHNFDIRAARLDEIFRAALGAG